MWVGRHWKETVLWGLKRENKTYKPKRSIAFMSKTALQLYTCISLSSTFFRRPLHDYTDNKVKSPIATFYGRSEK